MKARLYFGLCLLFCLGACNALEQTGVETETGFKTVTLEALTDVAVKSTVADDGTFAWADGDKISVYATDGKFYDFTYAPEGGNTNLFTGTIPVAAEPGTLAVYPTVCANGTNTVYAGGQLTLQLPETIEQKPGHSGIPMVASYDATTQKFHFKQVAAAFKFHFDNVPSDFYVELGFDLYNPTGTFTIDPTVTDVTLAATATNTRKTVKAHVTATAGGSADVYFPVATGSWRSVVLKAYVGENVLFEQVRTRANAQEYTLGRADMMVMKPIDMLMAEIADVESRCGGMHAISFMHASDTHAADETVDALADLVKRSDVPFSIMTGDTYFIYRQIVTLRTTGKPIYQVPGNHDVYQYYGGWRAANLYPYEPNYCYRKEHLDDWFSSSLSATAHYGTAADKACYYYFDVALNGKNLRVICLDQYDGGTAGWNQNNDIIISQEEADWLVDLLAASGDKDGVIIAGHCGYGNASKGARDVNHNDTFISTKARTYDNGYDYLGVGDPYIIPEIVEAYRTGNNLSAKEFASGAVTRWDGSGVPAETTLTVTTHFSGTHNNFIGYLGGHLHWDEIEYLPDFPQQLQMLIASGNNERSSWDDLTCEDYPFVINYYVVNFDTRKLTVHRIGAKKTSAGTYRVEQQFDF